jgi:hypothetical protein
METQRKDPSCDCMKHDDSKIFFVRESQSFFNLHFWRHRISFRLRRRRHRLRHRLGLGLGLGIELGLGLGLGL